MPYRIHGLCFVVIAALATGLPACRAGDSAPAPTAELAIVTASGQTWDYSVEVADTASLRRRGLMFREVLPTERGMLLLYESPREANIWMKNTQINLDILFIDRNGVITRVAANAVPYSETIIRSGGEVRAVLEINGGQAASRGMREGDRVIYAPLWPATRQ
ncbi:MAG: DUF192 domain-containing protein [Longimicrobiales bacterium]